MLDIVCLCIHLVGSIMFAFFCVDDTYRIHNRLDYLWDVTFLIFSVFNVGFLLAKIVYL